MKLLSYQHQHQETRVALLVQGKYYDLAQTGARIKEILPSDMLSLLRLGEEGMEKAHTIHRSIINQIAGVEIESPSLLAPIPNPPSCRDAYAFRQHVATARRNRGLGVIPEFDSFPVFYFTNHHAVYGEGAISVETDHLHKLDFELEVAIIVGKSGRNINSSEADQYIAGFTIMNDLSARQLQMEEMKLNLGPAKGKDFATVIGPWMVTPDELSHYKTQTKFGDAYALRMQAFHNGVQISEGNMQDMNWTFAEIIERASYGVDLYPGDVIGSGTVGTGCYLELNGTRALESKEKGEVYDPIWLKNGDRIDLKVEGLGTLTNYIVQAPGNHSILKKKKQI